MTTSAPAKKTKRTPPKATGQRNPAKRTRSKAKTTKGGKNTEVVLSASTPKHAARSGTGRKTQITREASEDYARAYRMFQLRAAGATYDEIGKSEGVSGPTAFRVMDRYIKNVHVEGVESMRIMLVQQYQMLLAVHWDAANDLNADAHFSSFDRVIVLLDRIAKIVGVESLPPLGMGDLDADVTIPEGGAKMVLGLTRDEYIAALRSVAQKQRAEQYDDPEDRPDDLDDEVADAEVVA